MTKNQVVLAEEGPFKEHLSKKYKPASVTNILNSVKYLLKNGVLHMNEAQLEDWLWHASLSTASRGHYRHAYHQYHNYKVAGGASD